jgi:hypothetical protein
MAEWTVFAIVFCCMRRLGSTYSKFKQNFEAHGVTGQIFTMSEREGEFQYKRYDNLRRKTHQQSSPNNPTQPMTKMNRLWVFWKLLRQWYFKVKQ